MMIKYLLLNFYLVAVMFASGCVSVETQRRTKFSGGSIVIAPGFRLHEEKARDTSAVMGKLRNAKKGIEVGYSIFSYRQVFADPSRLESTNCDVLWSRSSGSGILYKITTLAKDEILKTEKLYISFPNAGPANFVAPISSKEQIDEIESLVSTFRP